jgi:protein-L-isoaspartate(D-aspartate) O-methyltransferase
MAKDRFARAREEMVERQLAARGITDAAVLDAMRQLPRERFLPPRLAPYAYDDSPQPIGMGQTISQPYIVALMTQTLGIKSGDRVLEIGAGSGYQAAILAHMGAEVHSIEIIPELAKHARKVLEELGYSKAHVQVGDGYNGDPAYAPYQGIIVTCSPDHVPPPLVEQLAEGGRMVIPLEQGYPQVLLLLRKVRGEMLRQDITGVLFVPMTGEKTGVPTPQ